MEILIAVLIVAGIGIIVGIGLAVASSIFAVPKNEIEEQVRECLPGANCGACGFSGCDGYAAAIASGKAESISLCTPGGDEVAKQIAGITGKNAEKVAALTAMTMCNGTCSSVENKLNYKGIKSCKAANQLFGGEKNCQYGCLGYGDCAAVCSHNAISVCDGVARIDPSKCGACRKCAAVCPKQLITVVPKDKLQAVVLCSNKDKGAAAQKSCKVSCIGCGKCVKACGEEAITVENFLARIQPEKCIACGKCVEACPKGCIHLVLQQ